MGQEFLAAISVTCGEIGNCAGKSTTITKGLTNIAQIIIGLVGGLAILFILWGGIRYTLSRGDPGNIKAAKETVVYAVVGLVVAIVAYAIVSFVVSTIG